MLTERAVFFGSPVLFGRAESIASCPFVLFSREGDDAGQWRTINGAHVLIEDGTITRGPASLKGRAVKDLGKEEKPETRKPHEMTRADYKAHVEKLASQPVNEVAGDSPQVHEHIKNLPQFVETAEALHRAGKPIYLRSTGNIEGDKKRGYSTNYQTGQREAGLSVDDWNNYRYGGHEETLGDVAQLLGGHFAYGVVGSNKTYLLSGEEAGRGSDNEAVLKKGSVGTVAEIDQQRLRDETKPYSDLLWLKHYPKDPMLSHQQAVEAALKRGAKVPPEVLADYPKYANGG